MTRIDLAITRLSAVEPKVELASNYGEPDPSSRDTGLAKASRGAISLGTYGAYWAPAGSPALTPDGPTPWTFGKWVSDPRLPQWPGNDKISMCCWEWTALAALKTGATSRSQVIAWLSRIDKATDVNQQNKAIFDGDYIGLDVKYQNIGNGRYRAELSPRTQMPRSGQLITVDGADHVLIATNVKDGQVYVASFPEIPFGEIVSERGMYTKPFSGKLNDWLTKNINYYPSDPSNTNSWLQAKLKFGDPGFLTPKPREGLHNSRFRAS